VGAATLARQRARVDEDLVAIWLDPCSPRS
jgi:hypothetical protein